MSTSSEDQDRSHLDGFEVEIFKLVQKEATSEQWSEWLRAPLEHAAARGNMDLFTRLMDADADGGAGWRGCHGRTLLGAAACGKSEKMVLDLLRAGAEDDLDIMFDDHNGRLTSALHEAARGGAEGVSQALMLAGADPDKLDGDGNSPLDLAARAGHVGVVSDLLVKGVSLDANEDDKERSPLHLAAKAGHVLCVSRLLLSGADKDSLDASDATPLLLAAQNNHLGVVEKLLAAGADLGLADEDDWYPVEIAAFKGNVGVLKALLKNGGVAYAADDEGFTPLHAAAMAEAGDNDNSSVVRVLLEAGADVEAKTNNGSTPLLKAIRGWPASTGTVGALLEGGADIHARNEHDITPLRYACANSDVAVVELLLRWGADETLTHTNGSTVMDFVGRWEEGDVVEDPRRSADDECIRRMLARAPADRSWRRRGWLVLCRSRWSKAQLARGSSSSSSNSNSSNGSRSGKSAKGARLNGVPSNGVDEAGNSSLFDLGHLVQGIVDLSADGVFHLLVGFL